MKQYIGLEIEGVINGKIHKIRRSSRHGGYRGNGYRPVTSWYSESDGSIRDYNTEFNADGYGIEFVSKIFKSKVKFNDGLNQLKNLLSKNGQHELNEVMIFNKSCGCHIHLSTNVHFYKKSNWTILKNARNLFLKKIKNSNIQSKDEIINNYYRDYAKKCNKTQWRNVRQEFNTGNERDNMGFEWRSINMCGVKTWAEFDEFFKIVYECFNYLTKKVLRYKFKTAIYPKMIIKNSSSELNEIKINTEKDPEIIKIDFKRNIEQLFKTDNPHNEMCSICYYDLLDCNCYRCLNCNKKSRYNDSLCQNCSLCRNCCDCEVFIN